MLHYCARKKFSNRKRRKAQLSNRNLPHIIDVGAEFSVALFRAFASLQSIPMMNSFIAEIVGTMLLVLLGDGVVANVLLNRSKGQGGGWIVITAGWAFAVTVAVYCVGWISGGHLTPAVT